LGRGSCCINTAGEKIYPEEVGEVRKQAIGVRDAAVIGIPDERLGEAVVALVEPEAGHNLVDAALIAHVKRRLAGYKAPKRVMIVESLGRGVNGKLNHRQLRDTAALLSTKA
jgi:3-oxocholest-4-en-26-oate---CoA ligase